MAHAYSHSRVDEDDAGVLWTKSAPAWTFIHGPRSTLSSTALRNKM
jgi:nicotinate-nucleotide adenylyltransferase